MPYCAADKCPLQTSRLVECRGMDPTGSLQPLLYLLGDAPGAKEDTRGEPFVGESGDLLRKVLKQLGVSEAVVRMSNIVRCAPWNDDKRAIGKTGKKHVTACLPSVLQDIAKTRPAVIVTLGNIPTKAILHTKAGITSIRGTMQTADILGYRVPVVPTFNPAHILHSIGDETILLFFVRDLTAAWHQANGMVPAAEIPRDYKLLTTLEDVEAYVSFLVEHCRNAGAYITMDVETMGLHASDRQQDLLCLAISHAPYQGVVIPIDHYESPLRGRIAEISRSLQPLGDLPVVNQNIKFDYQWLRRRLGLRLRKIEFDTMLAHHCLFAGRYPNDLETIAGLHLTEAAWSHRLENVVKKKIVEIRAEYRAAKRTKDAKLIAHWQHWKLVSETGPGYGVAPLADLYRYACIDTDTTWRLVPVLKRLLAEEKLTDVFERRYMEPLRDFVDIQYEGIAVNNAATQQLKDEIPVQKFEIAEMVNKTRYGKKSCEAQGKTRINLGSPVQVASLFYDTIGFPLAELRGKSPRTTEADQLERLIGITRRRKRKTANKVLEGVKKWRTLDKYLGSYVRSIENFSDSDGLIHPVWNISGTRTGRMSCEDPPVHSMPAKGGLRRQITSRWASSGGCLLGADESQIEVRIFACLSGDRYLLDFYNNKPGADLHRFLASLLFSKAYEDVTAEERQIAKTCVFASLYGGGAGNLAGQTGMPLNEAKSIHSRFVSLIDIERFKTERVEEVQNTGYVTTPFGRRRAINFGVTREQEQHAVRQAMNTPIQSSASDIVLAAINSATIKMREQGLRSKIVLFHHDAVYWDVYPGELFKLFPLAQHVLVAEPMACYPWLRVPLKIGLEFGTTWGDKISIASWGADGLVIDMAAESNEETVYDRYESSVAAQFGPLAQCYALEVISSEPRRVVASVSLVA